MRTLAQIEVDSRMAMTDVKIAKEAVKAIKNQVNGSSSALECMELETESTYQVTTYRDHVAYIRACNLKRITPLNIKVSVQYTTPHLEISWLTEGVIDGKCCLAKITTYATWDNGWYMWDTCEDNGAPKAPYAEVFIKEQKYYKLPGNFPGNKTRI